MPNIAVVLENRLNRRALSFTEHLIDDILPLKNNNLSIREIQILLLKRENKALFNVME